MGNLGKYFHFLSYHLDCDGEYSLFDDTNIIKKDDKTKPSGVNKKAFLSVIGGNAFILYYNRRHHDTQKADLKKGRLLKRD